MTFLIKHGANVNAKVSNGDTLLLIAYKKGFGRIAAILLLNDADMTIENDQGHSIILYQLYMKKKLPATWKKFSKELDSLRSQDSDDDDDDDEEDDSDDE